jgi:hypothetical protein
MSSIKILKIDNCLLIVLFTIKLSLFRFLSLHCPMRFILTLIIGCTFHQSMAQNIPIDFEQGGYGNDWVWTTFENDNNPPLEIVPNPDPTSINPSSTVAMFTAKQNGQPWAGFESTHGAGIGSFSLDNENCTVKIMVWKSVISDVGIKFVDANNAAQPEIKVSNTLVDQWEELTFDFSSRIGVYPLVKDQIVIFPDFNLSGRTKDNVVFIDNIYGTDNTSEITNNQLTTKIQLYPNPSNDCVEIINGNGNIEAELFDILGNMVKSIHSSSFKIDDLPNGIYLFKIKTKGTFETLRLEKI